MSMEVKDYGGVTHRVRTELDGDGKETQAVTGISDWLFRRLFRAMSRLSFDAIGQLRVIPTTHPVTVSSGTVTTVTTCTTANVSMGDAGKPSASIIFSRQLIASGFKRNLIRS